MFAEPFFSELLLRIGVDTSQWVEPIMSAVADFFASPQYLWPTLVVIGMAVGAWLDNWLRRRDQSSRLAQSIDRVALADRASAIAAKVSAIYGEWQADQSIARSEDRYKMRAAISEGQHQSSIRSSSDNVNRKYIERYSEQCNTEVWSVIGLARKVVVVDRWSHWRLSHGVRDASDLYGIVAFLGHIEASLRHDNPDLPMSDEYAERSKQRAVTRSEEIEPQPLQDTATEKQR